jgi:two-component system phosphate regulon sensor histidine kinase PhoR
MTDGHAVRISVKDNGPGIARHDLKRVFDRFYRARDPLHRIIEGSGLGLAMVKHIVNGHGGIIEVESELEKGTTFTVTLPALEETK